MFKSKKDFLIPLLTVLIDIIAIEATFLFSYWFRFYSPFAEIIEPVYGIPPIDLYITGSIFVIPIWLYLFNNRGLYKPRRILYFSDEFFSIVKIVFIGMLVVMSATFFYRSFSYSRLVFVIIGISGVIIISIARYLIFKFEQFWYTKGKDLKRVLLLGNNDIAQKIFSSINNNPKNGYYVIGYCSIEDNLNRIDGMQYLGDIKSIPQIIKEHNVDVVLIFPDDGDNKKLSDFILACQGLNVEIMTVPDLLDIMTSLVKIKYIENVPFLGIKSPSLSTWNAITKRTFDIIFSLLILLFVSPFLILIAILIKIDSRGNVFYLQDRIGLEGKIFKLIKFRSMKKDAENLTGPVWTTQKDKRTTRIGKILRRFSIDELPQLINVLKGDMSIVGPRPERPHFVERFKKDVPRYLERHRVRTGMTGWAQVNGLRGNASIIERTKYDIYYVENWSIIFDLKIILKTIYAVLFGKDAY